MWRQKAKDGTTQLVGGLTMAGIVNVLHPVGDVIFSTDATNPGTRFPGTTWVAFGAGRAIVGVGSNGENTYTSEQAFGVDAVTLTAGQSGVNAHTHDGGGGSGWTSDISANHTHGMSILQRHATNTPNSNADNGGASTLQGGTSGRWNAAQSGATAGASNGHLHWIGGVSGASAATAHENRQKSIALYAWKRTA